MRLLCFEVIDFIIEFIKLYLAAVVLFQIRQRKSIWISFFAALFALAVASVLIDISEFSFISGLIVIGILSINAFERKKTGLIVLSYLGISIIDMIFASVCIAVFHLKQDILQGDILVNSGLNLFSLVLLLLLCFILSRKQGKYQPVRIQKYIVLYFFGAIFLSLYLTAVQFIGMGESYSVYGKDFVIGMSLSSLVLVVVCVLLIINSNQNDYLKREAEITAHLLESQKEYYSMLLEKEKETSAFRHDIKQHLYCMHTMYRDKKYAELGEYLMEMNDCVEELSPKIQTGNGLVSAIVNDISGKFSDVHLQWTGMIPDALQISSLDICTIFYNLLSNAFESVFQYAGGDVNVTIKFMESTMMITIVNPIREEPKLVNGVFVTSKGEDGHGYGIQNVKKCVERNRGRYSAACEDGLFITEVIIPNVL